MYYSIANSYILLTNIQLFYGTSYCKSYARDHIAIGNLVREIRSTNTSISHFSHSELGTIVSDAVSL